MAVVDPLRHIGGNRLVGHNQRAAGLGDFAHLALEVLDGNHSIFRHDNFIGCFSADKIKMSVRKYFCFNIPVYKNMAEGLFCRSPYHEEYIQTSASGNPEGLCRSTYSFLSERR